jgi:hypothetical protein
MKEERKLEWACRQIEALHARVAMLEARIAVLEANDGAAGQFATTLNLYGVVGPGYPGGFRHPWEVPCAGGGDNPRDLGGGGGRA